MVPKPSASSSTIPAAVTSRAGRTTPPHASTSAANKRSSASVAAASNNGSNARSSAAGGVMLRSARPSDAPIASRPAPISSAAGWRTLRPSAPSPTITNAAASAESSPASANGLSTVRSGRNREPVNVTVLSSQGTSAAPVGKSPPPRHPATIAGAAMPSAPASPPASGASHGCRRPRRNPAHTPRAITAALHSSTAGRSNGTSAKSRPSASPAGAHQRRSAWASASRLSQSASVTSSAASTQPSEVRDAQMCHGLSAMRSSAGAMKAGRVNRRATPAKSTTVRKPIAAAVRRRLNTPAPVRL